MNLGEAFKDKFEGVILSDANIASEGNFIKSNGVFTAVCSIHYSRSIT